MESSYRKYSTLKASWGSKQSIIWCGFYSPTRMNLAVRGGDKKKRSNWGRHGKIILRTGSRKKRILGNHSPLTIVQKSHWDCHLIHTITDQLRDGHPAHQCALVCYLTIRNNLLSLKDSHYEVSRCHKWCASARGKQSQRRVYDKAST